MTEVDRVGHFTIDLPSSDAATALCGPGNSFNAPIEILFNSLILAIFGNN